MSVKNGQNIFKRKSQLMDLSYRLKRSITVCLHFLWDGVFGSVAMGVVDQSRGLPILFVFAIYDGGSSVGDFLNPDANIASSN